MESASSGILAGYNMARKILRKNFLEPSKMTAIGALPLYISDGTLQKFQPMNANFRIIESLGERVKSKQERYNKIAQRALGVIKAALDKE